ncbi:MAG: MarR family winged helix-turn-helix transcriptional regulator [Paracoccaceae bacterium]
MSTKLTTSRESPAYEMEDSRSLKLVHLASNFEKRVQKWLVDLLHSRGFAGLTQSQLSFLGALDCGPNSASQIANSLGITRQAVHKTVKELETCGWLQSEADPIRRNQRIITFTDEGERMMSVARSLFKQLDDRLFAEWQPDQIEAVFSLLQSPFED